MTAHDVKGVPDFIRLVCRYGSDHLRCDNVFVGQRHLGNLYRYHAASGKPYLIATSVTGRELYVPTDGEDDRAKALNFLIDAANRGKPPTGAQ